MLSQICYKTAFADTFESASLHDLDPQSQYQCPCTPGTVQVQSTKAPVPGRGLSMLSERMWSWGEVFYCSFVIFFPLSHGTGNEHPVEFPSKLMEAVVTAGQTTLKINVLEIPQKYYLAKFTLRRKNTSLQTELDRLSEYLPSSHFIVLLNLKWNKKKSNSLSNHWRFVQVNMTSKLL